MTLVTLLPQSGTAGTIGSGALIGATDQQNLQFNPQPGVGFSGTVVIEGSAAGSPGASDWVQLASVIFSAHTQNVSINMFNSMPWMRARLAAGTIGAVAVFASI